MSNPDRIIRLKTVLDQTGLTRSTLYRKIDEGTFPRQISISARGTGWRESEVRRLIADPMGYDADELKDLVGACCSLTEVAHQDFRSIAQLIKII